MLRARKLFPAGSIRLGLGFIIRQPFLLHIYFIPSREYCNISSVATRLVVVM